MFQVRETSIGGLRYAGRSKAIVQDNVDPQKRGRILVNHPLIGESSVWIPYLTSPNTFSVPQIGDIVYIEADCGDYMYPIAWGNFTKKGGGAVPDEFLRSEPTNTGMYTPDNHLFEMDDGKGTLKEGKGIRFTTSDGIKFHLIDDEMEPLILLSDKNENTFKLDSTTNVWTWEMAGGAIVTLDGDTDLFSVETSSGDFFSVSADDGVQLSTPASGGTSASFKDGQVDFTAAQGFTFSTDKGFSLSATDTVDITATSAMTLTSQDSVTVEGTQGFLAKTAVASVELTSSGGIAIKGATGELLTLIDDILTELSTATYPGYGAPAANAANYVQIKAKLAGMKA